MLLASCAADVKFHSSQNGKLLHTYKSRDGQAIKNISWSKDGCWLALVPNGGVAELISIRDSETTLLQTLTAIQNVNVCVFQKTTKKHIVMGTQTGVVAVYDLKGKNIVKQFKRAKTAIQCIDCNVTDSHIAAACDEGDILLLSNTTNQISNTFLLPNNHIGSTLRFHKMKRNLLAAGSYEGSVAVWDINSGKVKWQTQAHAGPVTDVTFSPLNDNLLFTVGTDRKCSFFDTAANVSVLELRVDKAATCVDVHRDATCIALGSLAGCVALYDLRNMHEPLHAIAAHASKVHSVRFQPDVATVDRFQSKDLVNVSEEAGAGAGGAVRRPAAAAAALANGSADSNVVTETIHFSGFSPSLISSRHDADSSNAGDRLLNQKSVGDSFMDVIGDALGFSNASCASKNDDFSNAAMHDRRDDCSANAEQHYLQPPPSLKKFVAKIGDECASKTSTPKMLAPNSVSKFNAEAEPSPILSSSPQGHLEQVIKEMADGMKLEMMAGWAQIRHQFMNLHMSVLREFVQMDENLNGLRDDMAGLRDDLTGVQETDQHILDENALLKQQVEKLNQQIREMHTRNRH